MSLTAPACSMCGAEGAVSSKDSVGNTYCEHCTAKSIGWDDGQKWTALAFLDYAVGAALEAGVTTEQLFRHVSHRLEHSDQTLRDRWSENAADGILHGQADRREM